MVGAKWLQPGYQVWGITVSRARNECLSRLKKLSQETADQLDLGLKLSQNDFTVFDDYIGPGYGLPTPACIDAIRLVARTESIFLDPVYTGKAMAGLIDSI